MNWLDIVIVIILIVATVGGLRTGIIKSVISLAGIIVGVVLAGRFYVALAEKLTFIPAESIARLVAFVIIVAVVMIAAGIIAGVMTWTASKIMLGWLNALGGAVFGFVWGAIFLGALLAIWAKYFGPDAVANSALAPGLLRYFPVVLALLPDEFDAVRDFFK